MVDYVAHEYGTDPDAVVEMSMARLGWLVCASLRRKGIAPSRESRDNAARRNAVAGVVKEFLANG